MSSKDIIIDKLVTLKLKGIQAALLKQFDLPDSDELGFLERLNDLLDGELIAVGNKRRLRLQRQANLRWPQANISDVDYKLQPSLKKSVIANLVELEWIRNDRHCILTGATGTGKTHLACAIGNCAIMQQIPVGFYRFNHLLLQLLAAHKEGELDKFRKKLNRIKLLIIDDWGISSLTATDRELLYDLVESRDKSSSLLITSQYPTEEWYSGFQEPTIAESVLDRIIHSAHQIHMKGPSMREAFGLQGGRNEK